LNEILENSLRDQISEYFDNSLDNLTIRCNLVDKIENEQLFIEKEIKIDQIPRTILLQDDLDFRNESKKLNDNLCKKNLRVNKETMTCNEVIENEETPDFLNELSTINNNLTQKKSFCKILFEDLTHYENKQKLHLKQSNHYISHELNYLEK
jgi:hypothetical protein